MTQSIPDVARLIDHTLLKPDASHDQIVQVCEDARRYRFASVCVNPSYVRLCADLLKDVEDVKVCTVVGFPLGANLPEVKAYEAEQAIRDGATEVDMVQNVGALKSQNLELLRRDMVDVATRSRCVGVPELGLDQVDGHALGGQLRRVRVAQAVRVNSLRHAGFARQAMEHLADVGRIQRPAAKGAEERGVLANAGAAAGLEPARDLRPGAGVDADDAGPAAFAVEHAHGPGFWCNVLYR